MGERFEPHLNQAELEKKLIEESQETRDSLRSLEQDKVEESQEEVPQASSNIASAHQTEDRPPNGIHLTSLKSMVE